MEVVDAAGLSHEAEVDPVADVVAILTSNRSANISVRTSIKDQLPYSLESDSRLQSTPSLHQDLTSILTLLANDRARQLLLPGNSLLLVIKTDMSLIQESVHQMLHVLATPQIEDCRMMDPVELKRDTNASSMLYEVRNSHAKRNLVYKQHRPFQVLEHRYYRQRHQLPQLSPLSSLRSRISRTEPNPRRGL